MSRDSGNPNSEIRKRLMYLPQEDFYFLTYNIIILLSSFGCYTEAKQLKDFRKISYLIDFISSSHLANILSATIGQSDYSLQPFELKLLQQAYVNGKNRQPFINRLIYSFEKKNFVKTYSDPDSKTYGVSLNKDEITTDFLNNNIFTAEIENAKKIAVFHTRVRTVSLDNVIERFFKNLGVCAWLD